MADQYNRDREADKVSRENERRHQDAKEAMANKNAEIQREAQKVRRASDARKIAMRRSDDD